MLKEEVCKRISEHGGTPYYVGGCVRDEILGLTPKDVDIEVFGLTPVQLAMAITDFGKVQNVGESFGVTKVRRDAEELDISLPRADSKVGPKHTDFKVTYDPFMPVKEAGRRRDFTINTIYKNAITGEIIDEWQGIAALKQKKLIAVGPHFAEDPLRVLRGMQFCSRFNLVANIPTVKACANLMGEFNSLPTERVGEEWRKWCKGDYPVRGLMFLEWTYWIHHFREIENMRNIPQDPEWHPEGDCLTHVKHVCTAMAEICSREQISGEDREILMLAALCHDMGKPTTTTFDGEPPRYRSRGHDAAGVPIAEHFLKRIGIFDRVIQQVLPLVAEHMFPCWDKPSRRTIRRLKVRLKGVSIDRLLLLMEADRSGRPPHPPVKAENHDLIKELAADLPPTIEPIITGRHIIAAGITDGKVIGQIKRQAFTSQLDEEFATEEEGIRWLQDFVTTYLP